MSSSSSARPASPGPVAVVGATGLQGGMTARALLLRGTPVRAVVRSPDPESARALSAKGADLVTASLDDPASLEAAFVGVSALFAMTTPGANQDAALEAAHGLAIADAADAARVPYVVYSSVGGAERDTGIPHFDSKRTVEVHLLKLGINAKFVRPVFFMDNFGFMVPTLEDGTLVVKLPLPSGIPLQMIAAQDVGNAAAAAILRPDLVPGGAVEIAGDELTGEQIADAYGTRYSLPSRYEPIPIEALADNADQSAMFTWFANLPAYQADFAATRAMVPTVMTFGQWLAEQGRL